MSGNIAKTMTSNGKQFTVTREMLTAVAGISARYSKFALVLFCYITNHLMTGPLWNSEFCFPRISMFPETKSRETLRFEGNKIHCSTRDHVIKCLLLTVDLNVKRDQGTGHYLSPAEGRNKHLADLPF